ncbi:hypothetical protein T484DRAFT_1908738 [Baffinella frigidus]|nr:hypothetical protein T484DRAFT_1908738 [Cryptophyta sp. CCMP2293]
MFEALRTTKLQTVDAEIQGPYTVIPGPPAGWMPPIGASSNTWANIYKNKQRIDYCVDQFAYLTNRVKCVKQFTVGPFLATEDAGALDGAGWRMADGAELEERALGQE